MESYPTSGLASDAAHSEKRRVTEYQIVDVETGERIKYENMGYQTVNIGEYVGLVEAIKHVMFNIKKPTVVYTDSATAIAWYEKKYTASNKSSSELFKAEMYIASNSELINNLVTVRYWNTRIWGEIPADFGNK